MRNKLSFTVVIAALLGLLTLPAEIRTVDAENVKLQEQQIHINPGHYTVEPLQSDAARAIDAYERVMERYMNSTELNFGELAFEIKALSAKLDQIEKKIDSIDRRLPKQPEPKISETQTTTPEAVEYQE